MSDLIFSEDAIFSEDVENSVVELRNSLYGKFTRQIGLMLESKRPRKQNSTKGRLNTRVAYRHPFSDNIFSKHEHIPSSDTTVIMLIDGSGSMESHVADGISRIECCSAVCSAFAKSVKTVLKDQLKVEIFVKSAPSVRGKDIGVEGAFPVLTRVYSNAKNSKGDFDRLLKLGTYCSLADKDSKRGLGSYTAEYSVLPALFDWTKENITTKNIIVFNMTDGATYCTLGGRDYHLDNEDTMKLGVKYLRGVPNMTLLMGDELNTQTAQSIYGNNVIPSDSQGNFVPAMFKNLTRLVSESIE
tara:strand:- start:4058 stop:4957 length:900 start_codon:yes stop_codon:yes gene_type:complete